MGAFRFCIILCLGLAVLGCRGQVAYYKKDLDSQTVFTEKSEGAIVVVGIALRHPAEATGMLRADQGWFARWRLTSTASDTIGAGYASVISAVRRGSCSFRKSVTPCIDDDQVPEYLVFRVVPGEYMFWRVTYGREHSWSVLPWLAPKGDEGQTILRKAKITNTVPWFKVDPGEIVYIGDYIFDTSKHPAKLVTIEKSVVAARAALQSYPEIEGNLVFRPLSGGSEYAKLKMEHK